MEAGGLGSEYILRLASEVSLTTSSPVNSAVESASENTRGFGSPQGASSPRGENPFQESHLSQGVCYGSMVIKSAAA